MDSPRAERLPRAPWWAVGLIALQAVGGSVDFARLGTPPDPWVVALFMLPLPLLVLRSPWFPRTMWTAPLRAATVWLTWCLASIIWSITPVVTAGAALATIGMFASAVWFTTSYGFAAFARTYTLAMGAFLTAGLVRDLTIVWDQDTVHRFEGYSLHPNNLSHVALYTVLFSIVLIVEYRDRRLARWWSLIVGAVALFATGARTTMIAFVVCLLLMALRRLGLVRAVAIGAGLAAATLVVFSTIPDPSELVVRNENAQDISSINGRSTIWPIAIRATLESPIVGNGLSSGQLIFPQAARRGELPFPDIEHAHNLWLEQVMSTGLIGLTLMGLTFVSYFTTTTKRRGGLSSVIVIALLLVGTTEPVLSWRTSTYLVLAALLAERSMTSRSILDPTSRGPRIDQRSTPPTSVGTPS